MSLAPAIAANNPATPADPMRRCYMIPDDNKHYLVSFSGGKDSVASYLYLTRELKLPNVLAVFANTGHESEWTLRMTHRLWPQPVLSRRRGV